MKSFYQYAMAFRGIKEKGNLKKKLAEWMYEDHNFPKQSSSYDEISNYLEWNSPFPEAIAVFDELWNEFEEH